MSHGIQNEPEQFPKLDINNFTKKLAAKGRRGRYKKTNFKYSAGLYQALQGPIKQSSSDKMLHTKVPSMLYFNILVRSKLSTNILHIVANPNYSEDMNLSEITEAVPLNKEPTVSVMHKSKFVRRKSSMPDEIYNSSREIKAPNKPFPQPVNMKDLEDYPLPKSYTFTRQNRSRNLSHIAGGSTQRSQVLEENASRSFTNILNTNRPSKRYSDLHSEFLTALSTPRKDIIKVNKKTNLIFRRLCFDNKRHTLLS